MKLIEYLVEEDLDIYEAAKAFGVSIFAIRKWINGGRTPRPATQARIKRITKGKVTGDDWLPPE